MIKKMVDNLHLLKRLIKKYIRKTMTIHQGYEKMVTMFYHVVAGAGSRFVVFTDCT